MRTLKVTSPPLYGEDVEKLQVELKKDGYLKDKVDGVYGNLTAQAVYRAKYWLGYRVPDQSASDLLMNYLTGIRKPDAKMKARAAERKKKKPKVPMRQKALNWLSAKIGETEHPAGSNKIAWASGWYGLVGPWCAMACTRAYVESGSKTFKKGQRYAYVPYIVADARRAANGLALTQEPNPGDLVCFDWEHNGVADHVGLFVRWLDSGHTNFETVEGNTSSTNAGSQSNGGGVYRRQRNRSQVAAFVHCAR